MCMRYYLEAVSVKPTNSVLAAGVSLSLVLGSVPAVAFADEPKDTAVEQDASQPETNEASAESLAGDALLSDGASQPDGLPESSYDKADFYQGSYESAVVSTFALRSVGLHPREISKDMLYFGAFEGGTYDRTFSYGDGYHAMGYYQFDHRYGLKNFLLACYEYNPGKYAMFAQFANISDAQFKAENAIRNNGAFTALGTSLTNAWKAAYAADSYEFSRLQDDWAYTSYYLPAERYLASRGIDISDRSDAVKGLCWGLSNLFGQSGWRKFVGGVSDGYDWNGTYHYLSEGYQWPGCGLSDDMTDREFVTTLCNYVVDNVAVFYKGQPQYHEGWQNRYKKELNQCLAIIDRTGDTHAKPESNDEGALGGGESNEESGSNDGSSQGGSSSDDALSQGEGSNGNDSSQNDNSNDDPSGNDDADALPNGNGSHEEPGAGGPSDGNTSDGESDAGSNDSDLGDMGLGPISNPAREASPIPAAMNPTKETILRKTASVPITRMRAARTAMDPTTRGRATKRPAALSRPMAKTMRTSMPTADWTILRSIQGKAWRRLTATRIPSPHFRVPAKSTPNPTPPRLKAKNRKRFRRWSKPAMAWAR